MLTIEEVRAALARIDLTVDGLTFRWEVTVAWESIYDGDPREVEPDMIGYFIEMNYDEADIDTGAMEVQRTSKWLVSTEASISEVFQRCLKIALASAEHRTREFFLVDGVRVFGPHQSIDERKAVPVFENVAARLRAESRRVILPNSENLAHTMSEAAERIEEALRS